MDAADLDFGDGGDWDDIAAGIAAEEARRSRDASRDIPVPEVGSDGGAWRLASGDRLSGLVASVEDGKVHGTHSSACAACDGSGRPCPKCHGSGEHVRRVRLYTPHQVAVGLEFRRRRAEARAREAATALAATRAANGGFFDRLDRLDARARVPFVDEVMRTVERTGTLSQAQREVVDGKCDRLAELDARRRRSAPFGVVGEMAEVEVTVRSARMSQEVPYAKRSWRNPSRETVWSMSYVTRDGAEIQEKHWGDAPKARPGDVVRLRAKVKAHDVYDGVTRTFVSHARVLETLRTSSIRSAIDANPTSAGPGVDDAGHGHGETEDAAPRAPGM